MEDVESQTLVPGQEEFKRLFRREVLLGALPVLGIPMVVIGHLYLFDCKVQPYIPIFLLVSGYSNVLWCLLYLATGCCWEDNMACKTVKFGSYLILPVMSVWYIIGSVWVYSIKKVDFEDITSVDYCQKTLYYFSWWFLTISWSLSALITVLAILCGCCAAILVLRG